MIESDLKMIEKVSSNTALALVWAIGIYYDFSNLLLFIIVFASFFFLAVNYSRKLTKPFRNCSKNAFEQVAIYREKKYQMCSRTIKSTQYRKTQGTR